MCASNVWPTDGADAEYVESPSIVDRTCDYCGHLQSSGPLHQIHVGGSISWQCAACWERTQQRYAEQVAS